MEGTSGRILKKEEVILDGQYHLDMGQTQIDRDEPKQKKAVSVPAQVYILEDHPEYAVLKVSCACGAKICVRCEYASSKTPDHSQMRDSTAVESGQMN
jgi:hypothetical protein